MSRIWSITALTGIWLLLWGDLSALLVVGGVLVAVIATVVFPFPPARWGGRLRPWHLVVLLTRFFADLVVASFQVAWLAIRPAPVGPGAVIMVQLRSRSELVLVITGELVSLVPGTLLVELDAETSRIWLHVLGGYRNHERVTLDVLAQERRVAAALGSDEDFGACTASLEPIAEEGR